MKKSIARAMANVAKAMGCRVIAEGVEEDDELIVLLGLGCVHIQGYLIAKPMPPDELLKFIDNFSGVSNERP
ncbi:MAG: EAL domain-containing protein [Synergistaceae bacterium]|nr:EAL domain-containing protein [Synergistaceae bacterium]